jgi:hypothetical protein
VLKDEVSNIAYVHSIALAGIGITQQVLVRVQIQVMIWKPCGLAHLCMVHSVVQLSILVN